jgi:hypothetical protein
MTIGVRIIMTKYAQSNPEQTLIPAKGFHGGTLTLGSGSKSIDI